MPCGFQKFITIVVSIMLMITMIMQYHDYVDRDGQNSYLKSDTCTKCMPLLTTFKKVL